MGPHFKEVKAVKPLIPVKFEIFLFETSKVVTPLIFAVNTWPSTSPESNANSIKARSKLGSGMSVFWLKPTNAKPKNKIRSNFFIIEWIAN